MAIVLGSTGGTGDGHGHSIVPANYEVVRVLDEALEDGLSPEAVSIIQRNLDPQTKEGSQGISLEDLPGDNFVFVTLVSDASPSMSGVEGIVSEGLQALLKTLAKSDSPSTILVSSWTFAGERRLSHGFVTAIDAWKGMTPYKTYGSGTALYDTVLASLSGQVSYSQYAWNCGKSFKNIVVVFSDGGDNYSRKDPAGSQTKQLSSLLIEQGGYILAYVGYGCGEEGTKHLADTIGFNEVISADKTDQGIADLLAKLGRSIIRESQSTGIVRTEGFFEH